VAVRILVSAGEASGDHYAAGVVRNLRALFPDAEFFGCTGVEMRAAGVRTVVDSASLSVVGLVEVVHHIPRIYGEYRKLLRAARTERPDAAILTDSPDFHLRVAAKLHRMGIPVFYLIAPQAWAWRAGRAKILQRNVRELHCIFPFEEDFFRTRGVDAHYIGHPLAGNVRPSLPREAFLANNQIPAGRPLITLCPGSRRGESARHFEPLRDAVERIAAKREVTFVLAAPKGARERFGDAFYEPMTRGGLVRVIEGETRDAMAHSTVTLAASGTVTMEAALLGAPTVSFYRVSPLTWYIGKPLVDVPFYTMVNLVAGRRVIPELIQHDMTGERIASETLALLDSPAARGEMLSGLAEVADKLASHGDPLAESARRIAACLVGDHSQRTADEKVAG
jgi:lipid-A-disaccharide synthase